MKYKLLQTIIEAVYTLESKSGKDEKRSRKAYKLTRELTDIYDDAYDYYVGDMPKEYLTACRKLAKLTASDSQR